MSEEIKSQFKLPVTAVELSAAHLGNLAALQVVGALLQSIAEGMGNKDEVINQIQAYIDADVSKYMGDSHQDMYLSPLRSLKLGAEVKRQNLSGE